VRKDGIVVTSACDIEWTGLQIGLRAGDVLNRAREIIVLGLLI
jgi:hypothetical protein